MNSKSFVKLSNTIGIISIVLLIYWVFVYISIEVFGFKIFRENMTQTFSMSILGILALMFGALIINIMFNLSRIAEKQKEDHEQIPVKHHAFIKWAFILSFPVVFSLLYGGDYLTSKKKERYMIQSANSIFQDNSAKIAKLLNYSFNRKWISETQDILNSIMDNEKNLEKVMIIVQDTMESSPVYLAFSNLNYYPPYNDTIPLLKKRFVLKTNQVERDYIKKVFEGNKSELWYSANDGNYELYYPYFKDNKKMILYFSDYQRYGKMGS
jgi:hypothetical protein